MIRDFRASGRQYAAPAVMILDRTVHGVFNDGAELILTHNIVAVETKDGIERWGEVTVPSGGEILMLRTHKKDGTTREPEEIAGKEAISAPDLAVGDCVEWETLESKAASDAFAPGFLGERFYFQSFDSPLDRSEYLLLTPEALPLDIDRRAGGARADDATLRRGADGETFRLTTFAAHEVAQLFAERSAVPAIEYVPSVRVSSGVSWQGWARFLNEQLYGTWRSSPAIRELAATIAAAALDRWRGCAAAAAAARDAHAAGGGDRPLGHRQRRGGRRPARSRVGDAGARARQPPGAGAGARARAGRPRRARAGALAPGRRRRRRARAARGRRLRRHRRALRRRPDARRTPICACGTRRSDICRPASTARRRCRSTAATSAWRTAAGSPDQRTIDVTIRLDEKGGGKALATEELTGWPALEWAELMDRFGSDKVKLRQDFEQRWLGVQFPGARLDDLQVEVSPASAAPARRPRPRRRRRRRAPARARRAACACATRS